MKIWTAIVIVSLGIAGCGDPEAPQYVYGEPLDGLEFKLFSADMGVHPDRSVLDDPNNPFRAGALQGDSKWQVNDGGGDVAAFYGWATQLAYEPNGEHQFYTAQKLHSIFDKGLARPEVLPFVRELAIRGYTSVLENFPDDVTYDATGTVPYRLAPLAYTQLQGLGAPLPPGWIVVQTGNGGTTVIREEVP